MHTPQRCHVADRKYSYTLRQKTAWISPELETDSRRTPHLIAPSDSSIQSPLSLFFWSILFLFQSPYHCLTGGGDPPVMASSIGYGAEVHASLIRRTTPWCTLVPDPHSALHTALSNSILEDFHSVRPQINIHQA